MCTDETSHSPALVTGRVARPRASVRASSAGGTESRVAASNGVALLIRGRFHARTSAPATGRPRNTARTARDPGALGSASGISSYVNSRGRVTRAASPPAIQLFAQRA